MTEPRFEPTDQPTVSRDGQGRVLLAFGRGELRMDKDAAAELGWALLEAAGVDAHG